MLAVGECRAACEPEVLHDDDRASIGWAARLGALGDAAAEHGRAGSRPALGGSTDRRTSASASRRGRCGTGAACAPGRRLARLLDQSRRRRQGTVDALAAPYRLRGRTARLPDAHADSVRRVQHLRIRRRLPAARDAPCAGRPAPRQQSCARRHGKLGGLRRRAVRAGAGRAGADALRRRRRPQSRQCRSVRRGPRQAAARGGLASAIRGRGRRRRGGRIAAGRRRSPQPLPLRRRQALRAL